MDVLCVGVWACVCVHTSMYLHTCKQAASRYRHYCTITDPCRRLRKGAPPFLSFHTLYASPPNLK